MTFPTTALPIKAQWFVSGAWSDMVRATDVTKLGWNGGSALFGLDRGGVQITRGRTDETRDVDATTCSFEVWNGDGRFTPFNPSGSFYGLFGRNTPCRVGVTQDDAWLRFTGPDQGSEGSTPSSGARVTAPDSAALSIIGDLDVRLCADLDTWVPRASAGVDLVGKWTSTAAQKSWELVLQVGTGPGGYLGFFWSADGTAELGALSTVPVPVTQGLLSVRATIDVNNGAAGRTVTFYTSTDTNLSTATWTQLGDAVTTAGVTSIFDSTTVTTIGDTATGSQARVIRGKWRSVQIRNGIAGTVVANPDFTLQTAAVSSFADTATAPNTWTLTGAVAIEDTDWRVWGEVPAWRPRRDASGSDSYVPVTVVGVMRRLGMGNNPVQSPMRRSLGARTDNVAYWPLEDGSDAAAFGSAVAGGRVMKWAESTPSLASDATFVAALPLPTMQGSRLTGVVPFYTSTGVINLSFLSYSPTATADGTLLARLNTVTSRWDLKYWDIAGGSLQLLWYDADGVLINNTAITTFAVDNDLRWISIELTQSGANVTYKVATLQVGQSTGTSMSGTALGVTMGRATIVRTGHIGQDPGQIFGHIVVNTSVYSIYTVYSQLNAFIGETAGRRLERLAEENGVQFTWRGDLDATVEMGAQGVATVLQLLREAANTDHGILYEPRDRDGLAYRTRESLNRQRAQTTLSYTGHDLSIYEPAADDVGIVNQVSVKRGGVGSSVDGAEVADQVDVGPLSINEPPDGVGLGYSLAYTLNVNADADLPDHASWLLHLGTVDEPRIDRVGVELARTAFSTDALRAPLRAADVGDMITITDLPSTIGTPDDLRELVQGAVETLHQFSHRIEWAVSPASPYDVAIYDDPDTEPSRYTSDGTVLFEDLDTTETAIDVSTPTGPQWTTDAAEYPFDLRFGGERVTATACATLTATTQRFTVTRSVNGVVATHLTGDDVELWRVDYWDL